ncbi:hypothetical protein BKI52_29890 [marine bacterium AO1-C]|nr:hypothetical protein BKI52_29890 [marine bacterium AO1-C]
MHLFSFQKAYRAIRAAILLLVLTLFCKATIAQNVPFLVKRRGVPLVKNYSSRNYKADPVNFDVTQDKQGVLYFANSSGVLQYDGVNWQLLNLPNQSRAYSLAYDKNQNRVYVGGVGDFGYLSCDQFGNTNYISLKPLIPTKHRNFKHVWLTYVTDQGIFFSTTSGVYIFKQGKIKVIKPSGKKLFHTAFYVKGNFYAREWGVGLQKLQNERLKLVQGGEAFIEERIYAMLPFDEKRILIITRTQGLLLYDGNQFSPWKTEISPQYLKDAIVYFSKTLGDKYFAISTARKGIIILDKQGRIVQQIDESTGLANPYILNILLSKDGNIWVVKIEGISQITLNTPFSLYNQRVELNSNISTSAIIDNQAYFGTIQRGIFSIPWNKTPDYKEINRLKLLNDQINNIFDITAQNQELLVGFNAGIWIYNPKTKQGYTIAKERYTWKFITVQKKPTILLAGARDGLLKIIQKDQQWQAISVKGNRESIPYLAEHKVGQLFTSNDNGVLSKIILNPSLDSVISQQTYDTLQGLPSHQGNRVFQLKDQIVVATQQGIYRYQESQDRFEPHPDFAKVIGNTPVRFAKGDKKGNVWLWIGQPNDLNLVFLKKQGAHAYQLVKTPFQKLKNTFTELGTHINPIDEHNVIFSTPEGAAHYDPSIKVNYDRPYLCLVRKVETIAEQDSLVFGGSFLDSLGRITHLQPSKSTLSFPYTHNDLRFSFAATYYEDSDRLRYSYQLEGFDTDWSSWSANNQKEYTNLREGTYTFKVRGKNIYDKVSTVATYTFTILPPWYRTWWAYLLYGLGAIGLLVGGSAGYSRVRNRQIRARNQELERAVTERTEEILAQKEEITQQAEVLKATNDELKKANVLIKEERDEKVKIYLQEATEATSKLQQIQETLTQKGAETTQKLLANEINTAGELSIIQEKVRSEFPDFADEIDKALADKKITKAIWQVGYCLKLGRSPADISKILPLSNRTVSVYGTRLRKMGVLEAVKK